MTDMKDRAREYLRSQTQLNGGGLFHCNILNLILGFAEQETKELQEKLEGAEKARDYWKDSSFDWRHKCTSRKPFKVAVKAQKQLREAKEIIKQFLNDYPVITKELLDKLEQFIKEE